MCDELGEKGAVQSEPIAEEEKEEPGAAEEASAELGDRFPEPSQPEPAKAQKSRPRSAKVGARATNEEEGGFDNVLEVQPPSAPPPKDRPKSALKNRSVSKGKKYQQWDSSCGLYSQEERGGSNRASTCSTAFVSNVSSRPASAESTWSTQEELTNACPRARLKLGKKLRSKVKAEMENKLYMWTRAKRPHTVSPEIRGAFQLNFMGRGQLARVGVQEQVRACTRDLLRAKYGSEEAAALHRDLVELEAKAVGLRFN